MDVTNMFKATLKTIRIRKKHLLDGSKDENVKISLKKHKKERTIFQQRSADVVTNIGELKDFLNEHKSSYVGEFSSLHNQTDCMTEHQRDQIDRAAQLFMKTCSASIAVLKSEAGDKKNQISSHRTAVVQLLEEYLRTVCKLYSQQRAIRVKKAVDRKKMSRLNQASSKAEEEHRGENLYLSGSELKKSSVTTHSLDSTTAVTDVSLPPELDSLSKEEVQMFEEENEALLNDLNHLVDEVKQIEGKVIEISQLQEIFSEKVLDQASQIDSVHETTVSTTENVKEGNENIREAIKNSATFRVWILFFLVMCTFSLLFLDWYNQ